jgi:hypothetical protein
MGTRPTAPRPAVAIVARTGYRSGAAFSGSDELIGGNVATLPGGGEPSAVKSDFWSASDFVTGMGVMTALFMLKTFSLRRKVIFRMARQRRLSLSTHGLGNRGDTRRN